ncbi:unnamed protein product [Blepharisma stoltei]|uniref:Uncharacterized protein n=1 Tax=Blepharisma stoltei TaxID=1481888 RepID=A0AAU9J5W3_9CILI|nr:unnamed protein product [Blepharisma stoltei]
MSPIILLILGLASSSTQECDDPTRHITEDIVMSRSKKKGCEYNNAGPADYYVLSLQWKPSSDCAKTDSCAPGYLTQDFSIHGLWPNRLDGNHPFCCHPTDHFVPSQDLEKELVKYWQSFKDDQLSFWDHEWAKHGTCSLFKTPEDYFRGGLMLFKQVDPEGIFNKFDIQPGESHNVKEYIDALGDDAYPVCRRDKQTGETILSEVRYCFDFAGKLIICQKREEYSCRNGKEIKFRA